MIFLEDFDDRLKSLGREYFVFEIQYVPDIPAWAGQNHQALNEPAQPMKLIKGKGDRLVMMVQEEISDKILDSIINALSVRWTLMDVAGDITKRLDTTEKKLVYYFLKEYARSKQDMAGDELLEDKWAIDQMEELGFFLS